MKTFATAMAAAALVGSSLANDAPKQAYGPIMKPWEVSAGAILFTGDLDSLDFRFGFTAGVDYYTSQFSEGVMGFAGLRGWFASESGMDVSTYGIHYGIRVSSQAGAPGAGSGNLYFKLAAGYYNTSFSPGGDEWGFGGFAGVGWEMTQSGFGFEAGFQMGPENTGVNNQGFYGVVTFRF